MDFIEIETTPVNCTCVQVNNKVNYMPAMLAEAKRYLSLLKYRFANFDRVKFAIKSNTHDFGNYLSIQIIFDESDSLSVHQAYFIEENLPFEWEEKEILEFEIPNEYFHGDKTQYDH